MLRDQGPTSGGRRSSGYSASAVMETRLLRRERSTGRFQRAGLVLLSHRVTLNGAMRARPKKPPPAEGSGAMFRVLANRQDRIRGRDSPTRRDRRQE